MIDILPSTRPPPANGAPPHVTTPPIISAEHVERVFSDGVGVFELTFSIPPGTIFGLIGPSGCGKTTTVRLLTGVYQPDRGQLTVMGAPQATSAHASVSASGICRSTLCSIQR